MQTAYNDEEDLTIITEYRNEAYVTLGATVHLRLLCIHLPDSHDFARFLNSIMNSSPPSKPNI
jgi:hypothetical protein